VSITLSFVDLTKMVGFDGLAIEQLNLGDTVRVHFEHLAVTATTQVVRATWNVLLEQYVEIELGEIRPSLSSQLNTMSSRINNVSVQRGSLNITGVSVFHGTHRPEIANDNDLWFEPVNGYVMIHRRTNGHWQSMMSNRPSEQLLRRIEDIEDRLGIEIGVEKK
jgi:phage-related protein